MTDKLREAAQQVLEKIAKAHTKIDALCLGNERWTMSVPIRPDHDHDLVISGALYAAAEFIRSALAEQPAEQEPVADDQIRRIYDGATHAAAMAVFMTRMDAEQPDADDMGVSGWLQEAEDRVKRRATQPLESLLYTAPQPAKRVPLTDEEIAALWLDSISGPLTATKFARAIEAAHGITGETE